MWGLKKIAKTFGLFDKPIEDAPHKGPQKRLERPEFPARCIVFSDTDNDVNSIKNTLRFSGILNEKDEFTDDLQGITIFHTGDLIDKKSPDPAVVEYWQLLQRDALDRGGRIKLMAGNHEQEIWQKIRAGETFGLGAKRVRWLNEFIEGMDLFHVAGPVLLYMAIRRSNSCGPCCTSGKRRGKT